MAQHLPSLLTAKVYYKTGDRLICGTVDGGNRGARGGKTRSSSAFGSDWTARPELLGSGRCSKKSRPSKPAFIHNPDRFWLGDQSPEKQNFCPMYPQIIPVMFFHHTKGAPTLRNEWITAITQLHTAMLVLNASPIRRKA